MSIKLRSGLLALLALVGFYTGGWAYFAPENWYANFPGFGFRWLPQLGPYNMHLAKDDGAMFLALAALALLAIRYARNTIVVQIAATAWLVFNMLHFIYHMQHLHVYNTVDKSLNIVFLSGLLFASVALFLPAKRTATQAGPPRSTSRD
ncbi:hypothetical protein PV394_03830 [Streptomyces sp. NE06-03E]|uniref:hypothetical protein n=1 Tax=unclassified Streptomyces TaxID=2593676 RepID=UPI0029B6F786|nr:MULTISPECIES: hypothetical protein [unclassified Streptomyces]MDX3054275.1 hypothetical protein [Streptomyces sp. NE06-03E]